MRVNQLNLFCTIVESKCPLNSRIIINIVVIKVSMYIISQTNKSNNQTIIELL